MNIFPLRLPFNTGIDKLKTSAQYLTNLYVIEVRSQKLMFFMYIAPFPSTLFQFSFCLVLSYFSPLIIFLLSGFLSFFQYSIKMFVVCLMTLSVTQTIPVLALNCGSIGE
jgi:hypothetical protein